eukprot:3085535-Pyramimonas_sp.AAC.1
MKSSDLFASHLRAAVERILSATRIPRIKRQLDLPAHAPVAKLYARARAALIWSDPRRHASPLNPMPLDRLDIHVGLFALHDYVHLMPRTFAHDGEDQHSSVAPHDVERVGVARASEASAPRDSRNPHRLGPLPLETRLAGVNPRTADQAIARVDLRRCCRQRFQ